MSQLDEAASDHGVTITEARHSVDASHEEGTCRESMAVIRADYGGLDIESGHPLLVLRGQSIPLQIDLIEPDARRKE